MQPLRRLSGFRSPRLLTSGDVADLLGVSQATVLRAVKAGHLEAAGTTPGGHYRFTFEALWKHAAGSNSTTPGANPGSSRHADTLVTTQQLADSLGLSRSTVVRAVRRGRLQATSVTPGGHMRFSADIGKEWGRTA